jgi:hypothetical protein
MRNLIVIKAYSRDRFLVKWGAILVPEYPKVLVLPHHAFNFPMIDFVNWIFGF